MLLWLATTVGNIVFVHVVFFVLLLPVFVFPLLCLLFGIGFVNVAVVVVRGVVFVVVCCCCGWSCRC